MEKFNLNSPIKLESLLEIFQTAFEKRKASGHTDINVEFWLGEQFLSIENIIQFDLDLVITLKEDK